MPCSGKYNSLSGWGGGEEWRGAGAVSYLIPKNLFIYLYAFLFISTDKNFG